METDDKLKEIDSKNLTYYYFNDILNLKILILITV